MKSRSSPSNHHRFIDYFSAVTNPGFCRKSSNLSTELPTDQLFDGIGKMGTIMCGLTCGTCASAVGGQIAEQGQYGVKGTVMSIVGCAGVGMALGDLVGREMDKVIEKHTDADPDPDSNDLDDYF